MMKKVYLTLILIPFFFLTYAQLNMEELGHLPYSQDLSDVWGYVDEMGNEYALVGVYSGLSVVDVSNPESPNEVAFLSGPGSIWRDIKTWGDYAYVSNEESGGILIADLGPLPSGNIVSTTNFTGSTYPFSTAHNIYIDEAGRLYIFGSNSGSGGAIICDLTQDPMAPVELGRFDSYYLHDGMARGDTLWGAAIYQGFLAAIDVSDPSGPEVMGTISTPSQFTHNAWVSDDGSHVFTTDEVSSGYVAAFDVTDPANMFETDRIRSNSGTDVIPHNVHVNNDYLVTSYYADGIVVFDALHPEKLYEVGSYDTSPPYSGSGYHGSWGAYPFLPSGVILASDIEGGLYILGINYKRAAFLEGTVYSEANGSPIFNALVEILGTNLSTQTAFDGTYSFGTLISGEFDVRFSKPGYNSLTIQGVNLINGEIVMQDAALSGISVGLKETDTQGQEIRAYPNPFKESFSIHYSFSKQENAPFTLAVYTILGEQVSVYNLPGRQGQLTIGSDLPTGIYFIKTRDGNGMVNTRKIVKN